MVDSHALEVTTGRVYDEPEPVLGSLASLHNLVCIQESAPVSSLPIRSDRPSSEVPCR